VLGHRPVVTLFPPTRRGSVLAVVRHGAAVEPTPLDRALIDTALEIGRFLPPVGPGPVPDAVVHRARAVVEAEGLWLCSVDDAVRLSLALAHPGVAAVPAMARLVAIGGNHDVASVHLQTGQALQSLVLTTRLLGYTAAVAAWPSDLAGAGVDRRPGTVPATARRRRSTDAVACAGSAVTAGYRSVRRLSSAA
jgi:hypothetical protein